MEVRAAPDSVPLRPGAAAALPLLLLLLLLLLRSEGDALAPELERTAPLLLLFAVAVLVRLPEEAVEEAVEEEEEEAEEEDDLEAEGSAVNEVAVEIAGGIDVQH